MQTNPDRLTFPTIEPKFLDVTRRALIWSLCLHLLVPLGLITTNALHLTSLSLFGKRHKDQLYQSFIQVDMVALPEEVGLDRKFVDPTLPIQEKPILPPEIAAPPPPPAVTEEYTFPSKIEEAKNKIEAERKEMLAAEEKRKSEAEKKRKDEEERRKKIEEEKRKAEEEKAKRQKEQKAALEKLQSDLEREQALKALEKSAEDKAGKVGRDKVAGNILSKGTSSKGKIGKDRDAYLAIVQETVTANFNVYPWLSRKSLEAHVLIRVGRNGKITQRTLTKTSGNPRYDSSALAAVDATRQLPPTDDEGILAEGITIVFKPEE